MADGVDPQALALLRADSLSSSSGKFAKKSGISTDSDDFSRILDKQRNRGDVTDATPSQASEAGTDLPSDRPGVADADADRKVDDSAERSNAAADDGRRGAGYAAGNSEAQTASARSPVSSAAGDAGSRSGPTGSAALLASASDSPTIVSALERSGTSAGSFTASSQESKLAFSSGTLPGDENALQSSTTSQALTAKLAGDGPKETLGEVATRAPLPGEPNTRGTAKSPAPSLGDQVLASESDTTNPKLGPARDTAASIRQQDVRGGAAIVSESFDKDGRDRSLRDPNADLSRLGDGVRAETRTLAAAEGKGLDASPNPRAQSQLGLDGLAFAKEASGTRERAATPEAMAPLDKGLGPIARAGEGSAPTAQAAPAAPVQAAGSSATPAASTDRMPEYSLERTPLDPEFSGEVTARMKLLVREGVREARLQLHPAELGRLQVTVSTEGDQARVSFVAETAAARDAIEQSLPRLREQLEQNGLQLAQSDVGQQGMAERGAEQGDGLAAADDSGQRSEQDIGADDRVDRGASTASGRIDTYI